MKEFNRLGHFAIICGGLWPDWVEQFTILSGNQGQTTTPGVTFPTLCEKCVGSRLSPAKRYWEDARNVQELCSYILIKVLNFIISVVSN